jgi:superfamily I DNA/RNA helicase
MKLSEKLKQAQLFTTLAPHLIIEAGAGTGKTTTLVEGLNVLLGVTPKIEPSEQQLAIWMALAKSIPEEKSFFEGTAAFVAFNKSIADELKRRIPSKFEAMTMHSLGFKSVRGAFGNVVPDSSRVQMNLSKYMGIDIWDIHRRYPQLVSTVEELVKMCKMNLVGTFEPLEFSDMLNLASRYDITYEGNWSKVFELVTAILEMSRRVEVDRMIDYDDQVWLPIALNLHVNQYDILLVDEAQDLNPCQHALTFRAGKRLVYCGDPRQAIYGFTGADCDSMATLQEKLAATKAGCEKLSLTVTRRCGKKIVKLVNEIVPTLQAHESNPEGEVADLSVAQYQKSVRGGDLVVCRCNAPLVSECFRFLKSRQLCRIQGRDIGTALVRTIQSVKATSVEDLITKLGEWLERALTKERRKKFPSEDKLRSLNDRHDCLMLFCNAKTIQEIIDNIKTLFTDNAEKGAILCSSIHKAKGLEANRVFLLLLKEAPLPHPMAKTPEAKAQEVNLEYVAKTRAKDYLGLVEGTLREEAP